MTKVTKFDKATCREVGDRITAALAPLAAELGVSIRTVGGSYGPGQYTAKIEVATVADDGSVRSRAGEDFKQAARLYGLDPSDLGRTFRSGGHTFTISGLRSRASKRPVLASRDGREFCFAAEDVKRLIAVAK